MDFFEVTVEIGGQQQQAWKFLMGLMCPECRFCSGCVSRQNQISFFDGHVRALSYFGGVPARLVPDYVSGNIII